MATGKVIEASLLIPTKEGQVQSLQPDSKAAAAKYFRETKSTSAKKEAVVDTLEQQMKAVDELKSSEDYKLIPKEDTDTQDPLEHLTGGYNVVFTSKAKKAWQDVIYSLEENLNAASPKSKALIYKPETAKIVETLFELIGLKSEDGDEYLAPVQKDARNLLEAAIANGGNMSGIDPYSRDCVLRMLSSNKSEAIRGTIDLIRSEGLDKLTKKDSGFIGKLARSNGKLGKAFSEFVFDKIKALTTRPLDLTGDSEIEEKDRSEIKSLKVELFETTFQKIQEQFEKKKDQIKLKTDLDSNNESDVNFLEEFEKEARKAFTAEAPDEAEEASQKITGLIVKKVARIQQAKDAVKTATDLKVALSSVPKQAKIIKIPKDVINGLSNNSTLKDEWYKSVVANAKHTIANTNTNPASVVLTKKQIIDRLELMKGKAGPNGSVQLKDYVPSVDYKKTAHLSLTAKDIDTLIAATQADGTYTAQNWPRTSTLLNVNHGDVHSEILAKIKDEVVASNEDRLAKAKAIDSVDSGTLTQTEKLDKVLNGDSSIPKLSGESSWDFIFDSNSATIASDIKSKVDEYKKSKEADEKYYSTFVENMNKYVFTPIMTKAGTINETLRYALENSMITEEGTLREEFKEGFKPLADSAKTAINDKVAQVNNDLEALKHSTIAQVAVALNSALVTLGQTSYGSFITSLGQGSNEDVALSKLTEALAAAGSSLGTKEREILDASQDSLLSTFDLTRRQIERVNLISAKLVDLKTKNDKGLINKISNTANKTTAQNFVSAASGLLASITKQQSDSIKAKYDSLKTNFFREIERLEVEHKSLTDIQGKAEGTDVWELLTDNEIETGPIKGILKRLTQGLEDGLRSIMRSLGLFNGDNVSRLKQRLEALDKDTENQGFLQPMQKALVTLSNGFTASSEAKTTSAA